MFNLLLLLIAIILEACGDATIRLAIRGSKPLYFVLGSILLIGYGCVVSFPNWNFSRTMGVYIAMFFVFSQIVAVVMMQEKITQPVIAGGVLIVSGGLIILFSRTT